MKKFFKSTWFKILVAILTVLLAFIIFAVVTSHGSSPLSTAMGTVAEPFYRGASAVGKGFTRVGDFFTSKEKYKTEIENLESEIADLQSRLADYEQTKQKLELYEGALEIKETNPDYKFVSAVIIGKDSSNAFTTFTFNKGSADGISVNDPVIYGKGQLVGVVTKVSATYCVVSTILDPNVNVSAYEVRTRESGFISNSATLSKDGFCRLSGLDRTTSIAAGGIVCTTGVGGVYPRDLIVGTVKEVKNEDSDISSYAIVEPSADIDNLEDALIITEFDGQGASQNVSE